MTCLCTPASRSDVSFFPFPSSEEKAAKAAVQQAPDESQQTPDGTQLPAGHPSPTASQGSGSKCPFLAAQLSQTGSNVFRKASLELQEDVQEMHAVRKGNRSASSQTERGTPGTERGTPGMERGTPGTERWAPGTPSLCVRWTPGTSSLCVSCYWASIVTVGIPSSFSDEEEGRSSS